MDSIAEPREPAKPSPESLLLDTDALLDEFEGGDTGAWIRIVRHLRLFAGSGVRPLPGLDLAAEPAWKVLSPERKQRILRAAKEYIGVSDPQLDSRFSKPDEISWTAFAGNRALFLLATERPAALDDLGTPELKMWLPSVMADWDAVDSRYCGAVAANCGRYYEKASAEIESVILSLIEKERASSRLSFSIYGILSECWGRNGKLEAAMVALIQDAQAGPAQMGCVLGELLKRRNKEALEFARSLLPPPMPTDQLGRDRAVLATRHLVELGGKDEWPRAWQALQLDDDFGRSVIEQIAHAPITGYAEIFSRLGEPALADLYLWIEQRFPRAEDPVHSGAYFGGARDSIVELRNAILQYPQEYRYSRRRGRFGSAGADATSARLPALHLG